MRIRKGRIGALVAATLAAVTSVALLPAPPASAAATAQWYDRSSSYIQRVLINASDATKWCGGTTQITTNLYEQLCLVQVTGTTFRLFTLFSATNSGSHYIQVQSSDFIGFRPDGVGETAFLGGCGTTSVAAGQGKVCVSAESPGASFYDGVQGKVRMGADGAVYYDLTPIKPF